MWAAVLCCVLLLGRTAIADMHYILVCPVLMKANGTEKVCVQVVDAPASTPLKVEFEHPNFGITVSIFDEVLPAGDTSKCNDIFIPSVNKADLAYVSIAVGELRERKNVVVNGVSPFCFLQMAKPIYEAGETVTCRVICLNGTFYQTNEEISVFEITDPNGNLLMQQRNVDSENYFPTYRFPLPRDPDLGIYQVRAETKSGISAFQSFEVAHYVLPTFQCEVVAPQSVSILDDSMTVSVSGKYTYGQVLVAKVSLSICRKPNSWQPQETCNLSENGICQVFKGQLGPDGFMNVTVDLLQFQLARRGLQDSLNVEAVITENGTDVQVTETAYVWISRQMPTPQFNYETTRSVYKRGLNVTGSLTLRDSSNEPLFNETIQLYMKYTNVAMCVTDNDGNCPFSINTSTFMEPTEIIEARYSKNQQCFESGSSWLRFGSRFPSLYTQWTLTRFYSKSGSFVQLEPFVGQQSCGQTLTFHADFILNPDALAPGATSVTFTFFVIGKAEIKVHGVVEAILNSGGKGSYYTGNISFSTTVTYTFAPYANVIVSVLLYNGEYIADNFRFNVERCFENQVSLEYSTERAHPGSSVDLTVRGAPGSFCGIRAIDQSINILSGGRDQSLRDEVYNRMPYAELWGTFVDGFDTRDPDPPCSNLPDIFHDGVPYQSKDVASDASVATQMENIGMKLISSVDIRKPIVCLKPNYCPEPSPTPIFGEFSGGGFSTAKAMRSDGAGAAVVATIRQFFPQVWMFSETKINADGTSVMNVTIPDTITEWDTTAICLSDSHGFGVSNGSTYIIGFQPFFTEPTLPPSIVRGEDIILKGTAYNYMDTCTRVDLSLVESSEYTASLFSVENEFCICKDERTTHTWLFKALKLGSILVNLTAETNQNNTCVAETSNIIYRDTVIRKLEVEAEGIKREETQSALICTKDGPVSVTINLTLPPNLVNDSAWAFFTCVGDPMGISLRNLDDLVQLPQGCGEQTMSKYTSNLIAYDYLEALKSLDQEKKAEIINNLNMGYYEMLKFYLSYGCFTTWPRGSWNWNPPCNIWLTAMSYASLMAAHAKGIFIDNRMPSQIESWLSSQQDRTTGAFQDDGRSFNSLVKGHFSFTAYIAIAFIKAGHNVTHPVLRDAFFYLNSEIDTSDNTLGQALTCYAFALAGDEGKQNLMLDKLKTKAIDDVSGVFLEAGDEPLYPGFFSSFNRLRPARSIDIMMTAYYLSCFLTKESHSINDLTYAARIGKWLGAQMNSNGGFASTMDTVVALEAMAKFQTLASIKNGANTVNLKFGETEVHQFAVNSENSLLLQRADLPTVPGSYVAQVTGSGCVFCQTTIIYNILPENLESSFNLQVQTSPATCENGDQTKLDLHINVSYIGKKNSSDMVIMDVKLLTGFQAIESTLMALRDQGIIQRYELFPESHIVLYFAEIKTEATSLIFSIEKRTVVENLKSGTIQVYGYYEKDEFGWAEYTHPCSQPSSHPSSQPLRHPSSQPTSQPLRTGITPRYHHGVKPGTSKKKKQ